MKKILLASSALVLVGGAAFAESTATVTGSAEFGIFGGDVEFTGGDATIETQFHTDINVDFAFAGTSDAGVEFGAEIGLEEAQGGVDTTSEDDFTVFLSGDFGNITAGDTDGAFDWALQDTNFGMAGSLIDNEEHAGFNGMNFLDGIYDGQIVRYDISFSGLAIGVSVELDDNPDNDSVNLLGETVKDAMGNDVPGDAEELDDPMLGIGVKYDLDLAGGTIGLGAAYQGAEDTYLAGVSADAVFGAFSVGAAFFDGEIAGLTLTGVGNDAEVDATGNGEEREVTYYGISAGYSVGAVTVGINYGLHDIEDSGEASGYGLTAEYDLGGGLALQAGYGYSDFDYDEGAGIDTEITLYSFGVAMSF